MSNDEQWEVERDDEYITHSSDAEKSPSHVIDMDLTEGTLHVEGESAEWVEAQFEKYLKEMSDVYSETRRKEAKARQQVRRSPRRED